jgi:hypothetical protein
MIGTSFRSMTHDTLSTIPDNHNIPLVLTEGLYSATNFYKDLSESTLSLVRHTYSSSATFNPDPSFNFYN